MIMRFSVFFAVLFITGQVASAEDMDLSGKWSIATTVKAPCALTGEATLSPAPDRSDTDYACELTMRHACEGTFELIVRQTCKVRNIRGQITIISSIEQFLSDEQSSSYAPDNFRLSYQSPNELYGIHYDRYRSPTAIWTRDTGNIS